MAVFALDLVLWLTRNRGELSGHEDVRQVPATPAMGIGDVMRIVAVAAALLAVVSVAVWLTVRLAIELH